MESFALSAVVSIGEQTRVTFFESGIDRKISRVNIISELFFQQYELSLVGKIILFTQPATISFVLKPKSKVRHKSTAGGEITV